MNIKEIQEQQKTLLAEAEEQRDEIYSSIDYLGIDDIPETDWRDGRDIADINDLVECRQALVDTLELLNSADKKSIHNGRKNLEQIIGTVRRIRREKQEDILKAQKVIDAMNEILDICDGVRKQ